MTPTRWQETRGARGLVASPHVLASEAGLAVLRRGGNAVDAAIAAATTIAVVYPHMNSIASERAIEDRFGDGVAERLCRRGHDVRVVESWSDLMGHAHVIRLDADGLAGGCDPRADGAALGC